MHTPPALRLDHVILRTADPGAALAELRAVGLRELAPVQDAGGMRSGILRGGDIDVEVLDVGESPAAPEGYGLGLVARGQHLEVVARRLRRLGIATSPLLPGAAGDDAGRRTWQVIQLAGLLPDPFPVPFTRRPPGRAERALAAGLGRVAAISVVARAATRRAGGSMVVVTQHDFDVAAWRATVPGGPDVVEVEVGVGEALPRWERLGPIAGPRLLLRPDGPTGVRRLVLSGAGWGPGRRSVLGDVVLEGG